jgi:hypothetical protein
VVSHSFTTALALRFEFSGSGVRLLARIQLQVVGPVPLVAPWSWHGFWVRASYALLLRGPNAASAVDSR